LSAEAGLASSSAMMRRIDARISSIEGSWTFAGCVISDSTSKFILHQTARDSAVPDEAAGIFHRSSPDLSPDQRSTGVSHAAPFALTATDQHRWTQTRCESFRCLWERYVRATIDCKQRASKFCGVFMTTGRQTDSAVGRL
jgi:hypothetical protein